MKSVLLGSGLGNAGTWPALFGNEMRSSTDLHVHRQGGETGGEVTNVLQLLRLLRLLRLLKLGRHY